MNTLLAKLRALFRRNLEAEMAEEMRQHLERRTQEKIIEGMTPEEARYAAQREFGGVAQVQDLCRDERRFVWVEQLFQDLRYAARTLQKSAGLSTAIIVTLALGVSTATTMFTLYSAELLRPMPYLADESSLLRIRAYHVKDPGDDFNLSALDFREIRERVPSFSSTLMLWNRTFVVGGDERPERAAGSAISTNGFETLGVQPIVGRPFHADDGKPDAPEVVLLSHALWQRAFGGRPDIVGQTITVNHQSAAVVGVMPEGFGFPVNSVLWQPFRDYGIQEGARANRGNFAYARLAPGTTLQRAQVELDALAAQLEREHPQANAGLRFRAFLLRDEATRWDKPMLQLLLGAAVVVLLVACVNVANLLLARATARAHELAIRSALGAGRERIVRQVLTESLLLGAIGGAVSLPLARWEKDLLLALAPFEPPYWLRFDTDWRVLTFVMLVVVSTSIFFGLLPALQGAKATLSPDLNNTGRSGTETRRALRLRGTLVVAQTALALVLLIAGGLMARSFWQLANADRGFDAKGVLTFRTGLPASVEKNAESTLKFYEAIEEKLGAAPGVESVGFVSFLPMRTNSRGDGIVIEGRPEPKAGERQFALVRAASPATLATLRIPLRRGRFFDGRDRAGHPLVAVIDETFARKYFANEDPIGRRFAFDQPTSVKQAPQWFTIIGVLGELRQHATVRSLEPNIWTAMAQAPDNFMDGAMRVRGDPAAFTRIVHDAVRAVRPDTPAFAVAPMSQVVRDAIGWERVFGGVFASFAAIALFLASVGLYGVLAYSVAQRTREIGVRIALGARPSAIAAMIFSQGAKVVVIGLVIGLVAAWFAAASMAKVLHGVDTHDTLTFALVPLSLVAVALLACGLPARRAAKVDPMVALRCE